MRRGVVPGWAVADGLAALEHLAVDKLSILKDLSPYWLKNLTTKGFITHWNVYKKKRKTQVSNHFHPSFQPNVPSFQPQIASFQPLSPSFQPYKLKFPTTPGLVIHITWAKKRQAIAVGGLRAVNGFVIASFQPLLPKIPRPILTAGNSVATVMDSGVIANQVM